jgi:hypothetical protein
VAFGEPAFAMDTSDSATVTRPPTAQSATTILEDLGRFT